MAYPGDSAQGFTHPQGSEWMGAFNAVADPVFVHDAEYRIVYANSAYLDRCGDDADALGGRPYWEVFPRREGPLAGCRAALENGAADAGEDEFTDADGNIFISRGYPVHSGGSSFTVHILFDVTAVRREQSRLRRLRRALHEGSEAFITVDAERRIRYLNPAFERLLGYSADELIGTTPERLLPDDAAVDAHAGACIERDEGWHGETWRRHRDGSLIPVYLHVAVVRDERGRPDGWVVSLRDLRPERAARAELAEREAFYRTLLEDMPTLVCRWRADGTVTYVSDSYCRYFGKRREEVLGRGFVPLIPPEDRERVQAAIRSLGRERPTVVSEHRVYDARGEIRWQRWTNRALFAADGEVAEYQATGEDITDEWEAAARVESLALFPAENPYPVLRVAADGTLLLANPASGPLLAALGIARGGPVTAEWRAAVAAALAQRRPQSLEQPVGETRCLFTVAPIVDAGYANLYGTDVTELRRQEERLSRRLELEELLAGASRVFVDSAGAAVDGAIERTLATLGDFAGVDRSYLFLLEQDGERMSNTHEWCRPGVASEKGNLQGLPTSAFAWSLGELRERGQCHIRDVAALPAGPERETLGRQGIRSLVLVAVRIGGEMAGFIGFDAVRERKGWSDEDLRLLHLVADLVGSALARRAMEDSLRRANRALRTLSSCNEELVRATDETALLSAVCRRIVEIGGYRFVWVGYAGAEPGREVRPIAHAGVEEGYLEITSVTWADEPRGCGPGGTAIRSGEPTVVRFAAEDSRFARWRAPALERGYRSVAALPLRAGAETFGFLAIYSGEADAFDDAEVGLLRELADDLAFGVASLRARDEREQATERLARSEARLRRLVDGDPNAVLVVDSQGVVRFANRTAEALFRRPGRQLVDSEFGLPLATGERAEVNVGPPGEPPIVAEMFAVELEWAGEPCWLVTLYDVTELRRQEQRLRCLNRTHAVLSECNQALVRADSEQGLLDAFCERLTVVGGYPLAWVGFRENDPAKSVRAVARAGTARGYLDGLRVGWGDDEIGRGPTGTAIRTGEVIICRDSLEDPRFGPWREAARNAGLRSGIALPLWMDGMVVGTLQIYAGEPDAFDAEERDLLAELADDLAFGIHGQRTHQARERAEALLLVRNQAVESARNGIVVTTAGEGGIVYVNPAFSEITGYGDAEVIGRDPIFLAGDDRDQPGLHELFSALARGKEAAVLLRNYRKDGSLFWNEMHLSPVLDAEGAPSHYVGIINDVTERKRYEEQLEYQANFDTLTGLPNRNLMQDRLAQALVYAKRHGKVAAVLFLDIDRFKLVNDTLGHDDGDGLLRRVAERFARVVHGSDTVARYGGDEFVLILPDLARAEDASLVAERLQGALAGPMDIAGHDIQVTVSIGASIFPRDGEDGATLLKHADSAMYRAKELGRNNFQYFTAELNSRLLQRMSLESALRRALERDELTLHYQPQLDLRSGAVVGVEALVRWRHPELGMVSPAHFIPLAEETGLIVPIGQWVLRRACAQAVEWQRAGLPPVVVAVNVSARQLTADGFEQSVAAVLEETGLEPRRLELELTESAMMERPEEMAAELRRLKDVGVLLALDDFGTGYSSLSYLHRFPFDKVKIDQGFVHDITENPHNAAIVLSILSLAQGLGLTVIAEGVEAEAQLHYLRYRGCNQMQGFFFSRPLPPEEAALLLTGRLDVPGSTEEELPTLLVVDDEPNITRALQRLLRGEGYRVLAANTPEHAFELMALHRVQVLICDQRMPEVSGTDLLSRIKRLYPHTIRMILSGFTDLKTVTEAVNRGWVYKFLTKPWEDEELKEEVRNAFAEYEHARAVAGH